jgi:hypothetical protein
MGRFSRRTRTLNRYRLYGRGAALSRALARAAESRLCRARRDDERSGARSG